MCALMCRKNNVIIKMMFASWKNSQVCDERLMRRLSTADHRLTWATAINSSYPAIISHSKHTKLTSHTKRHHVHRIIQMTIDSLTYDY